MKRKLLILTLGAALCSPAFAQSTNTPPPDGPGGHHHFLNFLTDQEKQELKSAHDKAIQANPSLGTQEQSLHEQMKAAFESGQKPDPSLFEQAKSLHEQVEAAMIQADPNVAPIIDKIKAHIQQHHGGAGGSPPPPPSGT